MAANDRYPESFIVSRRRIRMSPENATELHDGLQALEQEILTAEDPDGELSMAFVYALYPRSGEQERR